MSDFNISIKVEDAQAKAVLEALRRSLLGSSLEAFLAGPGQQYLIKKMVQRFESEGDDASGRWADLAGYTVDYRESHGFDGAHPILFRTGELHAFLTRAAGTIVSEVDAATLEFPGDGTQSEERKLQAAQRGVAPNPIPGFAPVPPRPVAVATDGDAAALGVELLSWLEAEIAGAGLSATLSARAA